MNLKKKSLKRLKKVLIKKSKKKADKSAFFFSYNKKIRNDDGKELGKTGL